MNLDKKNKKDLIEIAENLLIDLYPICRSITGDGLRKTLYKIKEKVHFSIKYFKSGEKHFDWIIPKEWKIRDAYIKELTGEKIIDFKKNNLHVVNYSKPINKILSFKELKNNLHTLPDMPEAIPYRTTYYKKYWGFCLSQKQLKLFSNNKKYKVLIDSSLFNGHMNYGEEIVGNKKGNGYIITTYACHPSLANDNLSGIVLWSLLLKELKKKKLNNNYTFVIHPETIGAIAYISKNQKKIKNLKGGFVLSCVGGPGKFSLKKSFQRDSVVDRIAELSFKEKNIDYLKYEFDPNGGSDERQYSSPYFKIPMITICKNKYFEYDFYHTSLDNLNFISSKNIMKTLELYLDIIDKLEKNIVCKSLNQKCEPMLGKRGLYPSIGGALKHSRTLIDKNNKNLHLRLKAINNLIYYSNKKNSILDIAHKTGIKFDLLYETALSLINKNLLKKS